MKKTMNLCLNQGAFTGHVITKNIRNSLDISKTKMGMPLIAITILLSTALTSCKQEKQEKQEKQDTSDKPAECCFFENPVAVLTGAKPVNGYDISILVPEKGPILCHFTRGDSIDQYFTIHELPMELESYHGRSGVFQVDMPFPTVKEDTLGHSVEEEMFFQDVNFDGQEEFIVRHEGYNRIYFATFDLVQGNLEGTSPGLLEATNSRPYNNLVEGDGHLTLLDYKNKTLRVEEQIGCCVRIFTHSECEEPGKVKMGSKQEFIGSDSGEVVLEYMNIDDTLKLVNKKYIP